MARYVGSHNVLAGYPVSNSLSKFDFSGYDAFDSPIMPLFGVSFRSKNSAQGSCCLVNYNWEWDILAPEGVCICNTNEYSVYSLIVSVIHEDGIKNPLDLNYQIDFVNGGVYNEKEFASIIARDGTFQPEIFTISKSMDVSEEHPHKNALKRITLFESDAILEGFEKNWFYTFEGSTGREKYYDAFVHIVNDIITPKRVEVEKKENPHVRRKMKS
jgi:hypothetical protein